MKQLMVGVVLLIWSAAVSAQTTDYGQKARVHALEPCCPVVAIDARTGRGQHQERKDRPSWDRS